MYDLQFTIYNLLFFAQELYCTKEALLAPTLVESPECDWKSCIKTQRWFARGLV